MSSQRVPKMVEKVNRRSLTPLMQKVRGYLLGIKRDELPKEEWVYQEPNHYASELSAKNPPEANLPGGVHHLLSENRYEARDGRRNVFPPTIAYGNSQALIQAAQPITKGPAENFGLPCPTPGFGMELRRNKAVEDYHMKDKFEHLDKYDTYANSKSHK